MEYSLSNVNIDRACEEIGEFLKSSRIESKDLLRIKMGAEEVLLTYQKLYGENAVFIIDKGRTFGGKKIRITVPGNKCDPFAVSEFSTDEDDVMRSAMTRMGKMPRWRYRRGANEIVFAAAKRRMPEWGRLAIAVSAACILGILVRLLPASTGIFLHDEVIEPLIETFLGFLNAVAGPLIFLSVIWGINSIGDAASFSQVGKQLSLKYGGFLCLVSIVGALLSIPIFTLHFGNQQGGGDFSSLYRMVLDIIPHNLFTPFSQGNTLQILFVAIIVGISMLLISKDTQSVADLSEQLGFIVDGIMNVVSKLVPFFVFGSLFNIIVLSEYSMLAVGGKFFGATAIGCLAILILHTTAVCLQLKMSPVALWKKTLSTFIISITTASSAAAFSDSFHTCVDKLGISRRVVNFGLPFGQILYKPGVSLLFLYAAFCTAESSGNEVSVTWIVTALLVCIVLSAAAPPVPGGMSASFAVLFSQLGLPTETLAVILSLTSILDFMITAVDMFSAQCVLSLAAKKIGDVSADRG